MARTVVRGTPYNSQSGNSATTRRVASSDSYGKVTSGNQGNANDPMSNGSGIVLDGAGAAGALDSPVPGNAPVFEAGYMESENRAHLGSGNEMGLRDIVNGGGVLGRG